jgi:hypothetical protein
VTLSLRDVPLRTALQMLFQGSGLQHAVEPAVPNYPITLDIRDIPFPTALRTLLRLAPQVTYRKEGDVYIVGMRAPQVDTTAAAPEITQPDPATAAAEPQAAKIALDYTHAAVLAQVLGARIVLSELDVMGGAGGYGGQGSGFGSLSTGSLGGYGAGLGSLGSLGSGLGSGVGGLGSGYGSLGGYGSSLGGLGGYGAGLGGYGAGLGTGLGTGFSGPTARRF